MAKKNVAVENHSEQPEVAPLSFSFPGVSVDKTKISVKRENQDDVTREYKVSVVPGTLTEYQIGQALESFANAKARLSARQYASNEDSTLANNEKVFNQFLRMSVKMKQVEDNEEGRKTILEFMRADDPKFTLESVSDLTFSIEDIFGPAEKPEEKKPEEKPAEATEEKPAE